MLTIENLSISFKRYNGYFSQYLMHPIRGIDLSVERGEIVSVVGASGAGKSLVAHALLGLLPKNASVSGRIQFDGKVLTPKRIRALRGKKIAIIPQSLSYLNPLLRVRGQVERAAVLSGKSQRQARRDTIEQFNQFGLEKEALSKYPFEMSGGMARRVLCAAAAVQSADLIIADEPTKGLDHRRLKDLMGYLEHLSEKGKGVLLITHDLGAALDVSNKIAVFRDGMTVEMATVSPEKNGGFLKHPYSRMLFASLPQNEFMGAVNGNKNTSRKKDGCTFFVSCALKQERCFLAEPPIKRNGSGWVRCYHA